MPRRNAVKAGGMHYVYVLQSEADPARFYVGLTTDLKRRFEEHNRGKTIKVAREVSGGSTPVMIRARLW